MATPFELISDLQMHQHRAFAHDTMRNGAQETARKVEVFYRSQGRGREKTLLDTKVMQTGEGQHKHWVTRYVYSDGSTSTFDGSLWLHTPATIQ